ncbi:Hypothetical predicted protein [Cloeon dipterum]|uniref:Uncharacterized protein n=1 Tax=Cloeon dipterum TaxID=197152 RepID=A0A8S1BVU7_9INSE|nr:Hypothetical predicted protein [Cloeon dipterum]
MSSTSSSSSSSSDSDSSLEIAKPTSTPVSDAKPLVDDDGWDIMPKDCISSSSTYTPVITPSMLLYQQTNQLPLPLALPLPPAKKIEFKPMLVKMKKIITANPQFEADDDDDEDEETEPDEPACSEAKDGLPEKKILKSFSPEREYEEKHRKRSSPAAEEPHPAEQAGQVALREATGAVARAQVSGAAGRQDAEPCSGSEVAEEPPAAAPKTEVASQAQGALVRQAAHRAPNASSPRRREKLVSNSSPLVGLKRSVADSTISDSELQAAAAAAPKVEENEPDYHDYYEKHYTQYYESLKPDDDDDDDDEPEPEEKSPKRISLDDRIQLELGDREEGVGGLLNQIPVFQFSQSAFSQPYNNHYLNHQYNSFGQHNQGWPGPQPPFPPLTKDDARVLQVGNVLQVVPRDDIGENKELVAQIPKPAPSLGPTNQVGNVLQVVPQPVAPHPIPIAHIPMPSVAPVQMPAILARPKVPGFVDPAATEAANVRRLAKDVKLQEKLRRRAEREERRKIRAAAKMLQASKKLEIEKAKAAEEAEAEEKRLFEEALYAVPDEEDDDEEKDDSEADSKDEIASIKKVEKISPKRRVSRLSRTPPVKVINKDERPLREISFAPAEKGILLIVGKKTVEEEAAAKSRKVVMFSDGVKPGEGSCSSGGEEMTSPPPPSEAKVKRFTKTAAKKDKKAKKKKEPKVKPVKDRVAIRAAKEEKRKADLLELENLPPPPPPVEPPPDYLKQYYDQCKVCISAGYLYNPTTYVFAGMCLFFLTLKKSL